MNIAGMNPAVGGPVGGGTIMMMNNGNHPPTASSSSHSDLKRRLDTYIYDYFLKNGHHEHARALFRDESIKLNTHPHTKPSPSRRRDAEMNGIDENAMDTDSKDDVNKIPDDLPKPDVPDNAQSGFLYDWFGLFFDIYGASRNKKPDDSSTAAQYLQQTQMMQRMRETQHSSNVLGRQAMMPNRQFAPQMRNGMSQDMQRAMAAKQMSPAQFQQLQQHQQQKHSQMVQQMQREQSENEMNGHRPQSPASTDNAGSPSKRPRLEGQQFAGGPMATNGRPQPGPQQQQAMNMLMANGMSRGNIPLSQFQSFQAQNPAMQKNLQVYAQNLAQQQGRSMMNQGTMPNGMMNPGVMPNQGSPMLGPVDPQGFMQGISLESMFNNPQHIAALRQQANMQAGNGQGGNHALQEYQMQLMLLEQQNKKRLMMARQEQENITRTDGGPPMPVQPGMVPPGMSPASRAGASPNPNDQMKRGTPQLGANGMPASPSAGEGMPQARGSPAGMNFAGGMQQEFNNGIYMKNMGEGMGAPGAPGMRPPTSMNPGMNMEAIARQQGGRMPGGNWQGNPQAQPMMQQPPPGQPQAMGTPQQRAGEMPPPSAPAPGNGPGQRNPPPSPPPTQAPPTPSQANKPNPKSKKDKNEPKKRPNKRNSTANAPTASEADPPATPTPSTPITPVNQASFAKGPNAPAGANAPTSNPTPTSNPPTQQQQQQQQPQPQPPAGDPTGGAGAFGDFNATNEPFNLDFSGLDTSDVLENFDFDSFLHNTDDGSNGFSFDPAMNFPEGLETGGME